MGYSYDYDGRLCCNSCSKSGGVRKVKCPFGWCPPAALCPECRKKLRYYATKAYHRLIGCEVAHQEFARQEAEKQALLQQGKFLRTSALNHDGKGVKVLFRNIRGEVQAYFMSRKAYRSIPLLVNVTPDDFRSHGRLRRAKSINIYEAE